MKLYDYLIVGSGLFGATFAHLATKTGKTCFIIEKRSHIGGNVYDKNTNGINVHKYGAHIFHTSKDYIWEFVNSFVKFDEFQHSPAVNFKGKTYSLPVNLNTFRQILGFRNVREVKNYLKKFKDKYKNPKNLEEQALNRVGDKIYETIIKGYTEKQWGKSAKDLPAQIIKRLPIRFNYDTNYFDDKYVGIPRGGYNKLISNMLKGIEVKTNIDFFNNRNYFSKLAKKILFTGRIDEFFDFRFGELEYRSLEFKQKKINQEYFQQTAVVNYTDKKTPYTRIIEHKYFENIKCPRTIITYEYPKSMAHDNEPYYPINDSANNLVYKKYKKLANSEKNVIFGGRLAEYKYYDMDDVIGSAMRLVE